MFITPHTTIGALIGAIFVNPLLAFVLGVFSHLVFDVIPHGDRNIKCLRRNRNLLMAGIIDVFVATSLFFILWKFFDFNITYAVLTGIIGAALPDALAGLTIVMPCGILRKINSFLHRGHLLVRRDFPLWLGIIWQISVVIVALMFLLTR